MGVFRVNWKLPGLCQAEFVWQMRSFYPFFVGLNLAQGIGVGSKLINVAFVSSFLTQFVIKCALLHCLNSSPCHSSRELLQGIGGWFHDYRLLQREEKIVKSNSKICHFLYFYFCCLVHYSFFNRNGKYSILKLYFWNNLRPDIAQKS